jgi:epoxyqueuosine reductase QueG
MNLKEKLKQHAYELGADLVGFGNIERCRHAPLMMSPQGLMPGAKTVLVMALHHPDACIELGGEKHPQEIGPYSVQYLMNSRLDEMSYRMGTFLEKQGYGAIPIASSNIWRYNSYKDLDAIFAPDVSNIYMPVVAGLADMGYNGLALTPEFGARNRFVTVVTDAVVEPDPLIPPGTVCDHCMLCRKHCPSLALSKEIKGEKVLHIEDYEYRFADKNLWRCAWGEHFDLDLDLKIPETVTEEVIVEQVKEHGFRSGEMGQCLKFCVPKPLRHWDREYSRTPMRKYAVTLDEAHEGRDMVDRLLARVHGRGAEHVLVRTAEELAAAGIDLNAHLPGARAAVTVIVTLPASPGGEQDARSEDLLRFGLGYQVDSICYDLTREFEDLGFRSVMTIMRSGSHPDDMSGENLTGGMLRLLPGLKGKSFVANTVVTRKVVASRTPELVVPPARLDRSRRTASLASELAELARSLGADLVGVAPASRLDEIAGQIRPHFDGQRILVASDHSTRFKRWEPEVVEEKRRVLRPEDHLPGARSVLVFALRLPGEVLRQATRPPAEAVGPYAFQTYVTQWRGAVIGGRLVKCLEDFGARAALTMDLMNTGSLTANPRGPKEDLFSNRFAAVAAGLGTLTTSGHVATPEFGIRQRFVAIVTDADLAPSPMTVAGEMTRRCDACAKPCITKCPARAITAEEIRIDCAGQSFRFNRIDNLLCDWSKRYVLLGASGFQFLGSKVDVDPAGAVTAEKLADALRQHDPIKKYRPVVAEPCVIECPYAAESMVGKS